MHDEFLYSPKKGLPWLEVFFILCSVLFYINFEIQNLFYLVAPFFALAYAFYCAIKEPRYQKRIFGLLAFLVILSILYLLLTDSGSIGDVSNRGFKRLYSKFSQYMLVFFPLFLYVRTLKYATKFQTYIILGIGLLNAIVLVRAALSIAQEYELVLHSMNAHVLEKAGVAIQGYNFVYAFTFLVIACLLVIRKSGSKLWRILAALLLAYSLYFLFKAQFALAFVTTIISVFYSYYVFSISRIKLFTYGFLILFGIVILPGLIELVVAISSSTLLNERLLEISEFLSGNGTTNTDSDMGYRLHVYWKCIIAFLNSPLWGNRDIGFNGHSTFLTVFADLGVLGGYIVCKMFSAGYKTIKEILGNNVVLYKPLMLQIILMGLTNPIHSVPSNFIMLWFVCPLMLNCCIIDNKENINYE